MRKWRTHYHCFWSSFTATLPGEKRPPSTYLKILDIVFSTNEFSSSFCLLLTVSAWGREDDCEQLLWPHQSHLSTHGRSYSRALVSCVFSLIFMCLHVCLLSVVRVKCSNKQSLFAAAALCTNRCTTQSVCNTWYCLCLTCRNTHISSPDRLRPSQASLTCSLTPCHKQPSSGYSRSSWVWDVSDSCSFHFAGLLLQACHRYIGNCWGNTVDHLQRGGCEPLFACLWPPNSSIEENTPEVTWQWILQPKHFIF